MKEIDLDKMPVLTVYLLFVFMNVWIAVTHSLSIYRYIEDQISLLCLVFGITLVLSIKIFFFISGKDECDCSKN